MRAGAWLPHRKQARRSAIARYPLQRCRRVPPVSPRAMIGWLVCCLLLATNVMAQPHAATSPSPATACGHREPGDTRPRIGLALGGGGARGIAHVSVVKKI